MSSIKITRKFEKKTVCDFCTYHTRSGCMVTPNSHYCRQAKSEFFSWLEQQKSDKSKRPAR